MAFTDRERDIARQIKEQGGSREDFLDVLQQIREQEPKVDKVDKVDTPDEAGQWPTLWEQLWERVQWIGEASTQDQEVFWPKVSEWLRSAIWETPEGQELVNKFDIVSDIIGGIPWMSFIKDKIDSEISGTLRDISVTTDIVWAGNDVIWAWIWEVLEATWLDKKIQEGMKFLSETETWKEIWEIIWEWTELFNIIEKGAPWLATIIKWLPEGWSALWFGKVWELLKQPITRGFGKVKTKVEKRKELKKESIADEKVRTTAQILQAWDDVSDSTLKTISNFISKASTTKELREGFTKSATDIIARRNALIKEANKPITNTLLLTKSLVQKIDDLKAEGLVSPRVIKKYEERLKMEQSFVRTNKDQLDLLKVETRKENLNKLTERLQKKKDAWTLTDLESAELQSLDLVRDSYKIEIENIADTFFEWTDNVWSIKQLNGQFWDLQTALKLIKKESGKIRKSEDPAGFIRDKISKLPFIWDFIDTPSASAAVWRQERLKKKTKRLEKLN